MEDLFTIISSVVPLELRASAPSFIIICLFAFSKDFPVVPRSTVRQRACSSGSPFSGDGRGLQASPECVGSPYSCENSLNSGSPQELLSGGAPAPYALPRPHLQHSRQTQAYHCTKRKGRRKLCPLGFIY